MIQLMNPKQTQMRNLQKNSFFLKKDKKNNYHEEEDLAVAKGLKPAVENRAIVVYCRVSSQKQKSELANQKNAMEQFCLARGYAVDEWITEIGGGLNFKRRKFLSLIEDALSGKIEIIVIAHKDRLCRFAFDLIEQLYPKLS